MYALLWRDRLLNMLRVDVETLQEELVEGNQLLARLKVTYDKLPKELSRLFARVGKSGPE